MTRFRAYLCLLFLLPLPFGANTDWAWAFFSAAVFILLALECRAWLQKPARQTAVAKGEQTGDFQPQFKPLEFKPLEFKPLEFKSVQFKPFGI